MGVSRLLLLPFLAALASSSPVEGGSGSIVDGSHAPLFRVWVQYKAGTSRTKAFKSLKSELVATLSTPEEEADQLLRPDKDRPSSQFVSHSSRQFRVHHDFFEDGLAAIAMTANWEMLQAVKKDQNVAKVAKDPKRYPILRVSRKGRRNLKASKSPWQARNQEATSLPPVSRRIQATNNSTTSSMNETIPYGVRLVQADLAWQLGFRGRGIKVCVIDTGLDVTHPEFRNLTTWSGMSTAAGPWFADGDGHGTHITGTLAARANSIGVVGVAPKADVFTVRVFDNGGEWVYASGLVEAALACQKNGAKVINLSLSGDAFDETENSTFASLRQRGVVAVAAAGNDGTSTYRYPASYPSVVSVGAVDANKVVGWFSQRNDQVTVVAPGVDILSTVPGGKYEKWMGTSMAAPHVAGVVALLFGKNSSATGNAVVKALTSTAEDLGKVGYDRIYGNGLVSARRALTKV